MQSDAGKVIILGMLAVIFIVLPYQVRPAVFAPKQSCFSQSEASAILNRRSLSRHQPVRVERGYSKKEMMPPGSASSSTADEVSGAPVQKALQGKNRFDQYFSAPDLWQLVDGLVQTTSLFNLLSLSSREPSSHHAPESA